MTGLTAAEIAAFLGLTASGVRNVIARHQIRPIGKAGRAHLYDPKAVLLATGVRDRRSPNRVGQ